MSRGSRMPEHPRVLVETAFLEAVLGNGRPVQRRGFGYGRTPDERERSARELAEEQQGPHRSEARAG